MFGRLFMAAIAVLCVVTLSGCGDETETSTGTDAVTAAVESSADSVAVDFGAGTEGKEAGELPSGDAAESVVTGEFNADLEVKITKSARPVRRIQKQDVYGNVLSDDFYFYRNSLNKNEQTLYDQIYANCVEADPYFEFSAKVPHERAFEIYQAVRKDNPDLFWINQQATYTYDKNGYVSSMSLSFYDCVNDLASYKRDFYAASDSVLEKAMTLGNDADKMKFVHDLITNVTTYVTGSFMNQSAYSAVVKGKSVCAGYAAAFQYYMQRLGIPSGQQHLLSKQYQFQKITI